MQTQQENKLQSYIWKKLLYIFYCINLMNVNFIKTGVLRIRLFQAMMTTNVMWLHHSVKSDSPDIRQRALKLYSSNKISSVAS